MAVIREELVLADRFSAVFSKYLNMGRTASGTMQAAANSQNAFTEAAVQSSAALEEMAGTGSRAAEAVEEIGDAARQMAGASGCRQQAEPPQPLHAQRVLGGGQPDP